MMNIQPFKSSGATVNIDVSAASQVVALAASGGYRQVRIHNDGSATAWVAFGTAATTVTAAAGIPIGPGKSEVQTIANGDTHAVAIAAAATGKIYFTPGSGI